MIVGKVISLFGVQSKTPLVDAEPGQISLPFLARPKLFAVMATHIPGGDEFARLIRALRISCVLDLRIAPRLDFVAPTRVHAFQLFETLGITYRDILGRVDAKSYGDIDLQLVTAEVLTAAALSPVGADAGLLLFESPAFRDLCTERLEGTFEIDCLDAGRVDFYSSERLRM